MLGRGEEKDGKAGDYVWLTYQEVYDSVIKIGNSIRHCGVNEGGRCGVYGANSAEWVISMEILGDVMNVKNAISVISSRFRESQHRDRGNAPGRHHSDDRFEDDFLPHMNNLSMLY